MKTILASTIAIFGLAACGGSDLDPGAGDSAGTGTSTLFVDGSAHARSQVDGATTYADFDTDFSVHVSLSGQTVTTGTVTITSHGGVVPLVFDGGGGGNWEGTLSGYDEVYVLDVESGTDNLKGVRVDGPAIHTFTAPTQGATVDSTVALMVTWHSADVADHAEIRIADLNPLDIADNGTYSIAPGVMQAEKDKARENSIRLTRTDTVIPKGAVDGSTFSVSITNSLTVVAQPNPAL